MKKLFAVLITAVMMAAGLVAASGTTAQAACPYSGCVESSTKIDEPGKVERGDAARIGVKIKADGNADPKGQVTIKVTRKNGGYRFVDSKPYRGDKIWFRTTKLNKLGKYIVNVKFDRKPGSRWKDSDNTDTFRVVRP